MTKRPTLHLSFAKQNVRVGPTRWLFARGHAMRFEWIALLAYRRKTRTPDKSWVDARAIARLPHWRGKTPPHIGTNVGRYLQDLEYRRVRVVECEHTWSGPYRLIVASTEVDFDVPLQEVRRLLHLMEPSLPGTQEEYRTFTWRYAKAQALLYKGELRAKTHEQTTSAYGGFLKLAEDTRFSPNLRLLATIAAVDVQHKLGLYTTAKQTLERFRGLLSRSNDASLKARFFLAVSLGELRRASGAAANMRTEAGLSAATAYAAEAGDRSALGEIAERTGWLHAKNGRNELAIMAMLQALEAQLTVGNFDRVHATCCNIGSVTHRLEADYYPEARKWLLLSIRISHWMHLGRNGAHAEVILAKMDIEQDRPGRARGWLRRGMRVARAAGNQLDAADVRLMDALWQQSFGSPAAERRSLADAVQIYRRLQNFNFPQKANYIKKKFPTTWQEVLGSAKGTSRA